MLFGLRDGDFVSKGGFAGNGVFKSECFDRVAAEIVLRM